MTPSRIDRRSLLKGGAAGAAALLAPPALPRVASALSEATSPFARLGTNVEVERDAELVVEGALPERLQGIVYRNGPALFERDGFRKSSLLDGDGMIQAFSFAGGRVQYRARFVGTTKWIEEESAGRFLYPTWCTRAPGWHRNLPAIPPLSQAGVACVVKHNQLIALDEVGEPWALDPTTLETTGEFVLGEAGSGIAWKAHTKTDGRDGSWIALGVADGEYHVVVRDRSGRVVEEHRVESPGMHYIHDFFATPRYIVLNLHPAVFGPKGLLLMTGFSSVRDALSWRPDEGNRLLVLDRTGAQKPRTLEAPASWMWHSVNAYERSGQVVADFVGYTSPDHFLGEDAALTTVMEGRVGVARSPGSLRRYVIDVAESRVREEIVDASNHEFPMIRSDEAGHPHGDVWLCAAERGIFHDGLVRISANGVRDAFSFGPGHQVGEPIHAPDPEGGAGWIATLVFDAATERSALAVFDADRIASGPVAQAKLDHHAPYSFHGTWAAA